MVSQSRSDSIDNNLFRMSFILQDSNATTVERHLVKIIEVIIFDADKESLTVSEIRDSIIRKLNLEFDENEIKSALHKKHSNFVFGGVNNEEVSIKPECVRNISNKGTYIDTLRKYVAEAIDDLNLDVQEDEYCQLITNYLYQSFNANKNVILALISKRNNSGECDDTIIRSPRERRLINAFMDWENDEKNEFVYKLVSYCYVYCSMTVKKDDMLGKSLFNGKTFILDANIIFRLAGINNDSRKFSTSSFESKCKDLGIDLCYTNLTRDEIGRVISSRVSWINGITGGTEPIDTSEYTESENDFYKIYREWSKENDYTDFRAFQKYLNGLIYEITDTYKLKVIPSYTNSRRKLVEEKTKDLAKYKQKRSLKVQSEASLNTDVSNILFIKEQRDRQKGENLWSVNHYFISADQNLIAWANERESTLIPIVVLPSIWLTIMLRFTSRATTDDYKAFCSFMELRTSVQNENIDVYQLLEKLAPKTNRKELKEKIVKEVYENKDKYISTDYNTMADMAFDKILNEQNEKERQELIETRKKLEKEEENRTNEIKRNAIEQEKRNKRIDEAVEQEVKKYRIANNFERGLIWTIYIILWICMFWISYTAIWNREPGYSFFLKFFPAYDINTAVILGAIGIISTCLIALAALPLYIVRTVLGEDRINKKKARIRKRYLDIIGE